MKNLLIILCCSVFLFGCGDSNSTENSAKNLDSSVSNIEIVVSDSKFKINLPKIWEKMDPFPEKGIMFLARGGSQNVAITHEEGFTENISDRLVETVQETLSMIGGVSKEGDYIKFRGKISSMTPMREFYQKVIQLSDSPNFLLISCSQEVRNIDSLDCLEILDSFDLINE